MTIMEQPIDGAVTPDAPAAPEELAPVALPDAPVMPPVVDPEPAVDPVMVHIAELNKAHDLLVARLDELEDKHIELNTKVFNLEQFVKRIFK